MANQYRVLVSYELKGINHSYFHPITGDPTELTNLLLRWRLPKYMGDWLKLTRSPYDRRGGRGARNSRPWRLTLSDTNVSGTLHPGQILPNSPSGTYQPYINLPVATLIDRREKVVGSPELGYTNHYYQPNASSFKSIATLLNTLVTGDKIAGFVTPMGISYGL